MGHQEAPMNPDQHQHSAGQQQHSVRRIVLPSGRSIEVVRFHDTQKPLQDGLHVCPACDSDLVQPLAWSEAAHERWELTLECPNCWWTTEGTFDRQQVHELEDRLDDGLGEMLGDLKRLAHANMTEQIDRFVEALEADEILPEDF
jgi:hypothetical protein